MNWWSLTAAVLGGAALGSVLGKLLDLWLLEPHRARMVRQRWLRETRLEAFTKLSEELLSFGKQSGVALDFQRLRAIAARSELLVDDPALLGDLRKLLGDMFTWNAGGSLGAKASVAEDFAVKFKDGAVMRKRDIERTADFMGLEERANDVVARLGRAVRDT